MGRGRSGANALLLELCRVQLDHHLLELLLRRLPIGARLDQIRAHVDELGLELAVDLEYGLRLVHELCPRAAHQLDLLLELVGVLEHAVLDHVAGVGLVDELGEHGVEVDERLVELLLEHLQPPERRNSHAAHLSSASTTLFAKFVVDTCTTNLALYVCILYDTTRQHKLCIVIYVRRKEEGFI